MEWIEMEKICINEFEQNGCVFKYGCKYVVSINKFGDIIIDSDTSFERFITLDVEILNKCFVNKKEYRKLQIDKILNI